MYKDLSNEGKQKTFYHCSHDTHPRTPGRGCEKKKMFSLSHEMLLMLICWIYPMIATTGSDAAVVYCTHFYMFTMSRVSPNKHTHSTGGMKGNTLFSGSDSSSLMPGLVSPIEKRWCSHGRNTRPAGDDSALRSLAEYSACSSFDALFSTNTHSSFFLLFLHGHSTVLCFFASFCMIAADCIEYKGKIYVVIIWNPSFSLVKVGRDFWGEGEERQRFYFSLLLRVLLTTIWQWESQKQFLVWWNPADRQLDNIASRLSRSRSLRFLSGSRVMWKLVRFVCDAIKMN